METKRLLYIFISFAVAFILFILGFFALTPKEIEVSPSSSPSLPGAECAIGGCDEEVAQKSVALEGSVRALEEAPAQGDGTHQLEDNQGEVLAVLITNDDKLKMVEGTWVEIRGEVLRRSPEGVPLIEVEEISFKND